MDVKEKIRNIFATFISGVITSITFDLNGQRIILSFYFEHSDSDDIDNHIILFDSVASFYYVSDDEDYRFDKSPWEHTVLTNIYYTPGEDLIHHQRILPYHGPEHKTVPNFHVVIWEASLFIEARSVSIDGELFEVGYPVA